MEREKTWNMSEIISILLLVVVFLGFVIVIWILDGIEAALDKIADILSTSP
jgi:hypothetical protein